VQAAQKSLRQRLFDAAGAGNTSEVTRLLAEGDAPDGYHSAVQMHAHTHTHMRMYACIMRESSKNATSQYKRNRKIKKEGRLGGGKERAKVL